MNTIDKIKRELDSLTKSERKIASYFLGHSADFAFYTLDQIANEVSLSTTSVLRFCRKLGFDGYKDFRDSVRSESKYQPDLPDKYSRISEGNASDELFSLTFSAGIECIKETFCSIDAAALKKAVSLISGAKRVFTFGMRESYAMSHYAYTRLFTVRRDVYILGTGLGVAEPLLSLDQNDVCIIFLFHRYSKTTLDLLPIIKGQGAKIILITSPPNDAVKDFSTVLLNCSTDAKGIKNTSVAPTVLTDYLCNAVAVEGGNETLNYMKEIEKLFLKGETLKD